MSLSLVEFLKRRAVRQFGYLLREAEEVSAADALRYADPNWRQHPWGIGQNGSIAGIVYHVAAWKRLSRPLFGENGGIEDASAFDPLSAPAPSDWEAVLQWLREEGAEWNARLEETPEQVFEEMRPWEPEPIPLWKFVTEMIEHDIQHAAQIEYLKQRIFAEKQKEA